MRFVFRLLSLFALAVAVIMAVVEATRMIAAASWKFTPLERSWQAASPGSYYLLREALVENGLSLLWDPVLVSVLALPGWAVFSALALVLYAAGRRRRHAGTLSIGMR